MRKTFYLLLITFIFTIKLNTIAQSSSDIEPLIGAGITPQSVFYGIDRFFEDVSLFFTFSEEDKVEKLALFAEERLAELNAIEEKYRGEFSDKLYDDYGVILEKANNIFNHLLVNNKLSDDNLEKLQIKLEKVTVKEELIKSEIKMKINDEVKDSVEKIKVQTYLSTVIDNIPSNEIINLRNQNYNNGLIVRLIALSEISGLTIEEILQLDIYKQDDVVTREVEKDIDLKKLESLLGLSNDELLDQLKEYREAVKEVRKGNSGDEPDNGSQQAIDKQKEIKDKIKDKMNENSGNNGNNGNNGKTNDK